MISNISLPCSAVFFGRRWRRIFTIEALWFLANLVCTAILIVQLAYVLEDYVKPKITHTWDEEEPLEDMDFPVVSTLHISKSASVISTIVLP